MSVPRETATSGTGFSFPLPAQIYETGGSTVGPVLVTTASGGPLPAWIRFDAETRTFVASAVPDGGLPIQVMVTVGGKASTVVISERAESAAPKAGA